MRSLRFALIGLGLAGVMAATVSLLIASSSDHVDDIQWGGVVLLPLLGVSFVGTGIYAWWRRPDNALGALMVLVGFCWLLASLLTSDVPGLFAIGGVFNALPYALLIHMLLAFPSGRLGSRWERVLVGLAYFDTTVLQLAEILFLQTGPGAECELCPANPLLISDEPSVVDVTSVLRAAVGVFGLGATVAILVRRWRRSSAAYRAAMSPVVIAGSVTAALLGISLAGDFTGVPDGGTEDVIDALAVIAMTSIPVAFLVGLLRSRLSGAAAVSDLVARLGEAGRREGLRDALADALGDPSLELVYWVPDRGGYVDASGLEVELPGSNSEEACTPVEHDGRPVAMIRHSRSIAAEPELVETLAAAAGLALENERLDAELRARVRDVAASRARIVRAADEERRRLERDLHDGAQQRLVALALNLRLAAAKMEGDPAEARRLLDEAADELSQATAELRELARGIHPAVLTDRGLTPALEALTDRAPLPVALLATPEARLPAAVEAASYFVVAEALTNVARYARATLAEVSVTRVDGTVEVEVRDDGAGGADPRLGSGLRGLADRVAALEGRLEIDSEAGRGTTVRAVIPCE